MSTEDRGDEAELQATVEPGGDPIQRGPRQEIGRAPAAPAGESAKGLRRIMMSLLRRHRERQRPAG